MAIQLIKNARGEVIGRVEDRGDRKTYSNARGQIVGRYVNGQTLNGEGRLVGKGDQGIGLIFSNTK